MSHLAGIFGIREQLLELSALQAMRSAMAERGEDVSDVLVDRSAGFALQVGRFSWETAEDLSGAANIVRRWDVLVAADARVYDGVRLRAELAAHGVEEGGETSSELLLSAYHAWGDACARRVEGDFAFVVWDERSRSVFASRSQGGQRPLYFAEVGTELLVASTLRGITAHPAFRPSLNVVSIAEDAAVLTGSETETAYAGVSRLPAGCSLRWRSGSGVRLWRHFEPPPFEDRPARASGFKAASEELRELLVQVVGDRLGRAANSVWLSGGRDSPAVYAAGKEYLRRLGSDVPLLATSISYPPGDPGREDERIEQITSFWGDTPRWVRTDEARAFDGFIERVSRRDEPFPHPFESLLRRLASIDRRDGVRVSLDGAGGDQLFTAPNLFFSDLLFRLEWVQFVREWRKGSFGGPREFSDLALRPALDPLIGRVWRWFGAANPPAKGDWQRSAPRWIRRDFVKRHDLVLRERRHVPPRGRRSHSSYHAFWTLTSPRFSQFQQYLASFALEAGAEHRSPFFDGRLVQFAGYRPRTDRNFAGDRKRLLRSASGTLLPRGSARAGGGKPGRAHGYLERQIRDGMGPWMHLLTENSRLADLGITSPKELGRAWEEFGRTGEFALAVAIAMTLEVEAWLRARDGAIHPGRS